jgi:hypothetical protein
VSHCKDEGEHQTSNEAHLESYRARFPYTLSTKDETDRQGRDLLVELEDDSQRVHYAKNTRSKANIKARKIPEEKARSAVNVEMQEEVGEW